MVIYKALRGVTITLTSNNVEYCRYEFNVSQLLGQSWDTEE